jgi:hypothetical protein
MYDPTHKITVSATLRGFTQQRRGTQGHVQKVDLRSIGSNSFGASSLKNRLRRGSSWASEEKLGGAVIGLVTNGLLARAPDDGPPQADAAVRQADPPTFYRRSPAGGARLRPYEGGRNHGTANVIMVLIAKKLAGMWTCVNFSLSSFRKGLSKPVSAPRWGGTSPVFQRLAPRPSTQEVGQEVRRGETLG